MLKSLIIKLRHKPKVVRDQIAFLIAILFTLLLVIFWLFNALGRFESVENSDSSNLFPGFDEEALGEAPDFSEITAEIKELASTTITSEAEEVIPNEFPTSSSTEAASDTRPIRLATTTATTSSSTQNTQ